MYRIVTLLGITLVLSTVSSCLDYEFLEEQEYVFAPDVALGFDEIELSLKRIMHKNGGSAPNALGIDFTTGREQPLSSFPSITKVEKMDLGMVGEVADLDIREIYLGMYVENNTPLELKVALALVGKGILEITTQDDPLVIPSAHLDSSGRVSGSTKKSFMYKLDAKKFTKVLSGSSPYGKLTITPSIPGSVFISVNQTVNIHFKVSTRINFLRDI
ncbi:hypothetical protein [Ichthyobacterium seriolicida]|uniref:Uncharacterized protein n=1 Tax=Ichthyobacterium seriolicida TaxID=242600 RepID=A0A1J1DXG7_9FLAO|nr:hypothetical protein [Ichthyobacterium seriolicida]BAV94521.1 hypothetical protein JBKA6_0508 [Ichthyobacterium seriolicida]